MKKIKGFTLIELLVVVAIIALLISILLPSLSKAKEMARKTTCAAQLKGLGTSLNIYQEKNNQAFPAAPHRINPGVPPDPAFDTQYMGLMGGAAPGPARDIQTTVISPGHNQVALSRSLWLLIRDGDVVTKNFICPSSGDQPDPTIDIATWYDFKAFNHLSYGYQIPYDDYNSCKPRPEDNPKKALMADRGPWSTSGPLGQDTTLSGAGDLHDRMTGDNLDHNSRPEEWAPFNSRNHQGDGQNVLYPDGHVAFEGTPLAGPDRDNIYTQVDGESLGADYWQAIEWGTRWGDSLSASDSINYYPGDNGLGEGADSQTDVLLWP